MSVSDMFNFEIVRCVKSSERPISGTQDPKVAFDFV